jgi:hypothetical protein
VVCAQLGDKVGGILGGVDGQHLGDDQQAPGKLGNGELFPRALLVNEVIGVSRLLPA